MIIDDDEVFIAIDKIIIIKSGLSLDPLLFVNPGKALKFLEEEGNTDQKFLIFLDLDMPIITGWDFLEKIKDYPGAKNFQVVLISSAIERNNAERAKRNSQVIQYIEKPLSIEKCKEILQMLT